MNNIFIDLTSKNNQYICVEEQGSWLFHRFGKRLFKEEELDFDLLKQYIKKQSPKQITLYSILGDPMEYSRILDLLHFCRRSDIVVNINTNGFSKKIEKTLAHNIEFCFKIYGYKETLNITIPDASKFLFKNLNLDFKVKPRIQYMLYQHNLSDVKHVIELCKEKGYTLEIHPGVCVYNNLNHIISEDGEWLYDIHGIEEYKLDCFYKPYTEFQDLKDIFSKFEEIKHRRVKTMEGWHLLKNYVSDEGVSILDTPLPDINSEEEFNQIKCISYKGHIFNSIEELTAITNAYVPDWTAEKFDRRVRYNDTFVINIYNILCEFANSDKDTIESLL
ncbi:hypothetical protein OAA05_00770 [bacterium]|nr:hypothetical protein [bacterium]